MYLIQAEARRLHIAGPPLRLICFGRFRYFSSVLDRKVPIKGF